MTVNFVIYCIRDLIPLIFHLADILVLMACSGSL